MELIHGGDRYGAANISGIKQEELLDYSANLNPLGLPSGVREAVIRELDEAMHYPDPKSRRLKECMSTKLHIASEDLIIGNGGADIIFRLVFGLKPKEALLVVPGFAEYEQALEAVNTRIHYYELAEDFMIKEDYLSRITENVDILFLCNPNNPTGLLTEKDLMIKILDKARENHVFCVVDECFMEFVSQKEKYTLENEIPKRDNLFILKSFTKLYAMPGLRLGYGICHNRAVMEKIERVCQPWSVNSVAESAAVAALEETEYVNEALTIIRNQRAFLKDKLESMGLEVWNGQANYLFFKVTGNTSLQESLMKQGILIRSCGNYRGLTKEYYRIAVRGEEDNSRLVQAMEEILHT